MTIVDRPRQAVRDIPVYRPGRAVANALAFRREPIEFLRSGVRECGDIYRFSLLGLPIVLINHPDFIQQVLVEGGESYDKDVILFKIVRPILRRGLIGNADIELWRRQRRMMAPHFTPRTVSRFAECMTEETELMLSRWQLGATLDVTGEIGELALRIVNRALFSATVGERAQEFERAFGEANAILGKFFRFPFPPLMVPTPAHRRLRRAIARMDDFVSGFVRERIAEDAPPGEHADLLALLLHTTDDGRSMELEQLHHEVLNLCIGAYETTTCALSWALYLLARHPSAERALHAELNRVLGDRRPTFEDLPQLRYTRMIIDETLRLYSPAFQFMRRARVADEVGRYAIAANASILINSYLLHRHPDFWPDPERFDPERFTPEQVQARPKHAYLPFGSGQRVCIGKHFALTELVLVLATIARGHRLVIPDGQPEVIPEALITLHPRGGIHLRLECHPGADPRWREARA